jgi:nucleoside-diphosphate-sugar epimerase
VFFLSNPYKAKHTDRKKKIMTTLVVGASGATGHLLVEQLLDRGQLVKAALRTKDGLGERIMSHKNLSVIETSILDLSDAQMVEIVKGCDAVASCLGHNLTFKGMFGSPRKLVTDATRRLCAAAKANNPEGIIKFVLMNSTGNSNRDLSEPISFAQRCVMALIRALVPPHADNEHAADYLRTEIGQNDETIEWVVVRPDGLVDHAQITPYELHPSPIRSAIFDAGTTSRINVGHFMAELITDNEKWMDWKGKMPVIYNKE